MDLCGSNPTLDARCQAQGSTVLREEFITAVHSSVILSHGAQFQSLFL